QVIKELAPVNPTLDKLLIVAPRADEVCGDRKQDRGFAARPRGHPDVTFARCVTKSRIDRYQLGTVHLAFNDALSVRIEVVSGFQVARDQKEDARVRMIRTWPVKSAPEHVTDTGARATDVGVRIMSVDTPSLNAAIGVMILARATDVIHDAVTSFESAGS